MAGAQRRQQPRLQRRHSTGPGRRLRQRHRGRTRLRLWRAHNRQGCARLQQRRSGSGRREGLSGYGLAIAEAGPGALLRAFHVDTPRRVGRACLLGRNRYRLCIAAGLRQGYGKSIACRPCALAADVVALRRARRYGASHVDVDDNLRFAPVLAYINAPRDSRTAPPLRFGTPLQSLPTRASWGGGLPATATAPAKAVYTPTLIHLAGHC